MEHMSDQSALPNLNADWVNAKGKSPTFFLIPGHAILYDTQLQYHIQLFADEVSNQAHGQYT